METGAQSVFDQFYTPTAATEKTSSIPAYSDFISKGSSLPATMLPFESKYSSSAGRGKPSANSEVRAMFSKKSSAGKGSKPAGSDPPTCTAWIRRYSPERIKNPTTEDIRLRKQGLILDKLTFEDPDKVLVRLVDCPIGAQFKRSGKFVVFTLSGQNQWDRLFASTDTAANRWTTEEVAAAAKEARTVLVLSPIERSEEFEYDSDRDTNNKDPKIEEKSVEADPDVTIKVEGEPLTHHSTHHAQDTVVFTDSDVSSDTSSDSEAVKAKAKQAELLQQLKALQTVDLTSKKRRKVLQQASPANTISLVDDDAQELPLPAVRRRALNDPMREVEQQQRQQHEEVHAKRAAERQPQEEEDDELNRALAESVQQCTAGPTAGNAGDATSSSASGALAGGMTEGSVWFSAAQLETFLKQMLAQQMQMQMQMQMPAAAQSATALTTIIILAIIIIFPSLTFNIAGKRVWFCLIMRSRRHD